MRAHTHTHQVVQMVRLVEGGQRSPDVDEPTVQKAKAFDLYTTEELLPLDRVAAHPLKNESQAELISVCVECVVCVCVCQNMRETLYGSEQREKRWMILPCETYQEFTSEYPRDNSRL